MKNYGTIGVELRWFRNNSIKMSEAGILKEENYGTNIWNY